MLTFEIRPDTLTNLSKMNKSCTLIQRRNSSINQEDEEIPLETYEETCERNMMSLMEETLLLYLNQDGHISFLDECLSPGLRACILVELEFKGRIFLEPPTARTTRIEDRKILTKGDDNTGDVLLDEALKHIKKANPPESVQHWISYLGGTSWNPLKLKYHLKFVRERVAKNLVEKGVLAPEKSHYFLFETMTYPTVDNNRARRKVTTKIREALLANWKGSPEQMDARVLALIVLADVSDVLDKAFAGVHVEDYAIVMKRLEKVFDYVDRQAKNRDTFLILFAVFAFFTR